MFYFKSVRSFLRHFLMFWMKATEPCKKSKFGCERTISIWMIKASLNTFWVIIICLKHYVLQSLPRRCRTRRPGWPSPSSSLSPTGRWGFTAPCSMTPSPRPNCPRPSRSPSRTSWRPGCTSSASTTSWSWSASRRDRWELYHTLAILYSAHCALMIIFSKTLTGKAIGLDVSFHAQLSLFKQL